ncbi:MAG: DUF945 family protein [Pseudomonadota bacterium]
MKKTLIALAALGLAYVGAAYTTGALVQRQMDGEIGMVSRMAPMLKISEDTHTRGLFGSTRVTSFDLAPLLSAKDCAKPEDGEVTDEGAEKPQPALGMPPAEPLLISIKSIITHGPLPGFGLPAAAALRYELLFNGQPVGDGKGLKLEGAMPKLSQRYGFTGNSVSALQGGAGKLIYTPKAGQGDISLSWSSVDASSNSKADLSAMDYEGQLPELRVGFTTPKGETGTLTLKGLALKAQHQYPIAGQMFVYTGSDHFSLASVEFQMDGKALFAAETIEAKSSGTLDSGLLNSSTQISLASVKAGGEVLGPMHYDFTLARLDAPAYGQLMDSLFKNDLGRCPTPEQTAALVEKVTAQLPALLKSGPEFRMDRISIGYQGQQALITGKFGLPAATAEQLANPVALIALADVSLTVSLPDQLIENLAVKSMGQKMALAEGVEAAAATPEQRAEAQAAAKGMVAQQMRQALARNWVVRSQDGVTSTLEYHRGTGMLNGQLLDLEALRGGAPAAE